MATRPEVLLIDDGELDDVRALLEQLHAPFVHLRGGSVPARVSPPTRLFITTSRRAVLARDWAANAPPPRPRKIAVVTEDSNTLRSMLRRIGFDLLVRRPVHPYALRLVVLRALYHGQERRREQRIPVGFEVSLRAGLRRKPALLADLSARGARLLMRDQPPSGTRLTLQIPKELAGERALTTRVRVLRSEAEPDGTSAVAVAFEKISPELRAQLSAILKRSAEGPARLPGRPALGAGPVRAAAESRVPLAAPASDADRRKHDRVSYAAEVRSLDEEAETVLMGRDLSVGGMRIARHPSVRVGDLLQLALYAGASEEPCTVHALVVRDEGERGMGLKFEHLSPGVAARLESIVAGLPEVESLDAPEAEGLGNVVTRLLAAPTPAAAPDDEGEDESEGD